MEVQSVLVGDDALVRRIIKRYSNRKLYDTQASRYVTLLQIADMVRSGEEIQIIDNATKEDKTEVTMALIISEELKGGPRTIPLDTLKALIQNRGERLVGGATSTSQDSNANLADGKQRVEEGDVLKTEQASSPTLEQRQSALESKLGGLVDVVEIQTLQSQVQSLSERLSELERRLFPRRELPRRGSTSPAGAETPPKAAQRKSETISPELLE